MPRSRSLERLLPFARRARGIATTVRAIVHLVLGIRRRRVQELWIGDSHAVCFNMPLHVAPWSTGSEGQVVLHLPGRLMYSTAVRGLPPRAHRVARLVRRFGRSGTVVPFLCTGEIDVRCHLVPRSAVPGFSLDFVGQYVGRAAEIAEEMGSSTAVIVVPIPQSDRIPEVALYPIRGTIAERVAMTRQVRDRLLVEAAAWSGPVRVRVLDVTDVLAEPDGSMRLDLTDDGVHTNRKGIELVRAQVARLHLE